MQCPKCRTINDDEYIFCVNCGESIGETFAAETVPATQKFKIPGERVEDFPSVQTQYVPHPSFGMEVGKKPKRTWIFVTVGVLAVLVLGGFAAVYFLKPPVQQGEVLPDYLGIFYQNKEKTQLTELKKLDSPNILDAKDKLLKDETLPVAGEQPEMILYADSNDVPIADLKLIPLDSVKGDGTMRQIDFQAAPVEAKPAMKRLKFSTSLAIGKYAFARIDGYFDEGKHKFWAFEIKTAEKKENGDLETETVVAVKPKQIASVPSAKVPLPNLPPVPKPEITVPAGARIAYCNDSNVVVRSAPSLTARKVNGLRRGQRVYVMRYSSNSDYWRGIQANWAYIQTETGKSGWVFSPFISY